MTPICSSKVRYALIAAMSVQFCERIVTTRTRKGSCDSSLTKTDAKSLDRIGSVDWRIRRILLARFFSAVGKIAKSLDGDIVSDEYGSRPVDKQQESRDR